MFLIITMLTHLNVAHAFSMQTILEAFTLTPADGNYFVGQEIRGTFLFRDNVVVTDLTGTIEITAPGVFMRTAPNISLTEDGRSAFMYFTPDLVGMHQLDVQAVFTSYPIAPWPDGHIPTHTAFERVFFDVQPAPPSPSGSGGGCNAPFLGISAITLAAIFLFIKRR